MGKQLDKIYRANIAEWTRIEEDPDIKQALRDWRRQQKYSLPMDVADYLNLPYEVKLELGRSLRKVAEDCDINCDKWWQHFGELGLFGRVVGAFLPSVVPRTIYHDDGRIEHIVDHTTAESDPDVIKVMRGNKKHSILKVDPPPPPIMRGKKVDYQPVREWLDRYNGLFTIAEIAPYYSMTPGSLKNRLSEIKL